MAKTEKRAKKGTAKPSDSMKATKLGAEKIDAGNMDMIRDILFGQKMRDYEKRFQRLEERLVRETGELREEMGRQMETLESYIRREIDAVGERLKKEVATREEGLSGLTKEVKELGTNLNRKIDQAEEIQAKEAKDLREEILALSKRLARDIQDKHDQIQLKLEQVAEDLGNEKVDRQSLADFFMDLSMRLSDDSAIGDLLESKA